MQEFDIDNIIAAADTFSNQSQDRTHCVTYLLLRKAVAGHIQCQQESKLNLCQMSNVCQDSLLQDMKRSHPSAGGAREDTHAIFSTGPII